MVGGLLGGGIYAAHVPGQRDERVLHRFAGLLWSLLVVLTVAAGVLNLMPDGLPPVLAVLKVIVIALVVAGVAQNRRSWTSIQLVWTVGMIVSGVCTLIGLIPRNDFMSAAVVQTLAGGVNLYIGEVLAAVALAYWLMHRFSNVTPLWAEMSLNTVAGLLALAGALVTVSTLVPLGAPTGVNATAPLGVNATALRDISTPLVPLLYLIFAAHSYHAFSNRNPTNTLAAHWTALGVLLLVLGVGLLGGVQAAMREWTAGTRLSDLQTTLTLWAVVAILLGMINQVSAEMRGHNRRVTGLAPFWLVAFGAVGGGLALAGAGLVQVYLERRLSIGYLDVQTLLVPLYEGWLIGLAALAVGVLIYAAILWRRRPSNVPPI